MDKPEAFITALYPVDDIYVLWDDVDDTKPAGQQHRNPPEYGAERARFLALCADGKLRAVVFGECDYTLEDFEDGVHNQGIYTGEGLARFMPKAKISFWDGSKDPRPDFLHTGKKPVCKYVDDFQINIRCCPVCGCVVEGAQKANYCPDCGQKIDWGE